MTTEIQKPEVARTGIPGLDEVLCGGLPRHRIYLVQGDPGVGKTTLAVQFLREGISRGETCLYVTLSESIGELRAVVESHGWSLDGMNVFELSPLEDPTSALEEENTLYLPAEVELGERMQKLLDEVGRVKPARLVIDSCSELRLLATSPLRFRRQILLLKQHLEERGMTVLLLENPTTPQGDVLLQSLVHGVISLEQQVLLYGGERRRLRVIKLREVEFRGGFHDFSIRRGGLLVFPRLIAAEHGAAFRREQVSSGVPAIDQILCGGPERGTAMLIMGPAGSGKSALATQYSVAAASRGECVAIFTFDEGNGTLFARAAGTGMDLRAFCDSGHVLVQQIDPAEMPPGQFVHAVRLAVTDRKASIVVIDSINGLIQAMPDERYLMGQLHEMLNWLRQHGVLTVLVMAQHGLVGGAAMQSPVDVSYLADSVVLTRYFEAAGRVRKAMSVVKNRSGRHEDTIREFALGPHGFEVGPPLDRFRGVLTGVPTVLPESEDGGDGQQGA